MASTTIPAVMIDNAAGVALKSFLAGHLNHTAVIDPLLTAKSATANEIAYFSSRGPSFSYLSQTVVDFGLKPDLVAPGTDIFTATQKSDPNSDMWNPDGYGAYSGISRRPWWPGGGSGPSEDARTDAG
jgi:hypothetical protein